MFLRDRHSTHDPAARRDPGCVQSLSRPLVRAAVVALAVTVFGATLGPLPTPLERSLNDAFVDAAGPASLGMIPSLVTRWGEIWILLPVVAITAAALFCRGDRATGMRYFLMVVSGYGAMRLVKQLVWRERPSLGDGLEVVAGSGFPSGHATLSALVLLASAMTVPRLRRTLTGLALMLTIAVGLSRLSLAAHWPGDVVAGWLLGSGWVLAWRWSGVCGGAPAQR